MDEAILIAKMKEHGWKECEGGIQHPDLYLANCAASFDTWQDAILACIEMAMEGES